MRFFKRTFNETRGGQFDHWGTSIFYLDIDKDGFPSRQIEKYQSGDTLKYDIYNTDNQYGGLGGQALDFDEFKDFEISEEEFNKEWIYTKIRQNINKDYYEEFYSEWVKSRSTSKKWQVLIGVIGNLFSFLIFIINGFNFSPISVGFLAFGLIAIFEFYSSKRKWMKTRLKSKMNDTIATFIFQHDKIVSNGPFTNSVLKWDFFTDVIESEKGVFLIPENGISIYIQKESFPNRPDINNIINKIKNRC